MIPGNTDVFTTLEMSMTDLTKDEAYALADFIDIALYDRIRNDTDIDSMTWLKNMLHAYEKLCAFSGYVGLTEDRPTDIGIGADEGEQ